MMTKTFKSERAARLAYTKAEKAYKAASDAVADFRAANRPLPYVEESDVGEWADEARTTLAQLAVLEAAEEAARLAMVAVWEAAEERVWSYYLSHNPARELAALNID